MDERKRAACVQALVYLASATLSLAACAPDPVPSAPAEDNGYLFAAVAGDAAKALRDDGTFVLEGPTRLDRPVINGTEAAQYAELAARQYGRFVARDLQSQHGGPIDFDRLRACLSPVYARGSFEDPPSDLSREAVYYLGGFWLVAVCNASGLPQVSVAVAVNAADIRVERGILHVPPNSIKLVGIPPSWNGPLPISAEAAALRASTVTGVRVAAVPVLVAPNPLRAFPQGAYWVIGLEKAVTVRGQQSNTVRSTPAIVIGTADFPGNSMRRGSVELRHRHPASPNTLQFRDFVTGRTVLLAVASVAALSMEGVTPVEGGR